MESESRQPVAWTELIAADHYLDPERKKRYAELVQRKDGFVPPSVQSMLPEDVLEIEKAVEAIDVQVAKGIPSYAYYVRLLRKIQVLLVEHSPEFFATLPPVLQGKIRNAKIEMPTEQEVQSEVFDPMDMPGDSLKGGFTFGLMVKDVLSFNALSKKLAAAYGEYRDEFERRKKAA